MCRGRVQGSALQLQRAGSTGICLRFLQGKGDVWVHGHELAQAGEAGDGASWRHRRRHHQHAVRKGGDEPRWCRLAFEQGALHRLQGGEQAGRRLVRASPRQAQQDPVQVLQHDVIVHMQGLAGAGGDVQAAADDVESCRQRQVWADTLPVLHVTVPLHEVPQGCEEVLHHVHVHQVPEFAQGSQHRRQDLAVAGGAQEAEADVQGVPQDGGLVGDAFVAVLCVSRLEALQHFPHVVLLHAGTGRQLRLHSFALFGQRLVVAHQRRHAQVHQGV